MMHRLGIVALLPFPFFFPFFSSIVLSITIIIITGKVGKSNRDFAQVKQSESIPHIDKLLRRRDDKILLFKDELAVRIGDVRQRSCLRLVLMCSIQQRRIEQA